MKTCYLNPFNERHNIQGPKGYIQGKTAVNQRLEVKLRPRITYQWIGGLYDLNA